MAPGLSDLSGTWQAYKYENYETFLKTMGVEAEKLQEIATTYPTLTLQVDENTCTVRNGDLEEVYRINGATEEKALPLHGYIQAKVTCTSEGDKVISKVEPTGDRGKPHTTTRELINGELVMTLIHGDIVCKRYYKRV